MIDLFIEIGQTLRNNKLRTALTGIAVAWGIFMLIVLLGVGRGVINSFHEHVGGRGSNSISIYGGTTSVPYKGYKEGRSINLKQDDIDVIMEQNSDFARSVVAEVSGRGNISTQKDYITTGYSGVYPQEAQDRGLTVTSGRFINEADIRNQRKVIVLEQKNVDVLFPGEKEVIGKSVELNDLYFKVIGIYTAEFDRASYIPFSTAMSLRGNDGYVDELKVNISSDITEEEGAEAENRLRGTLASVHEFKPDDTGAVWIWNRFMGYIQMSGGMTILNVTIWIIGLLTLLSGIVGVSNIMFVSVRERTHEIGIRRAIGARPKNILTQILTESVAITALFGYIGIFFGILVTEILKKVFEGTDFISNPTVDISIAIEVTVLLILAGALAGLFPAFKALKVKPVEALRDE